MNKEEIEELKDFTIDITDIDELALGLEVCSKKSNMIIQEFANLIIELQQENKQLKIQVGSREEVANKYKEVIDEAIEYIEKFIPIDEDTILMKERQRNYLLDILNDVSE